MVGHGTALQPLTAPWEAGSAPPAPRPPRILAALSPRHHEDQSKPEDTVMKAICSDKPRTGNEQKWETSSLGFSPLAGPGLGLEMVA